MTFLQYVQSPDLTSGVIDEIIEEQAVRLFQSLDRAAYERLNKHAGLRIFIVQRAIQEDIAAAAITSLVITEGIRFQFDEQVKKGLVALGLSQTMIDVVRREVRHLSQHESLSDQYISRPWKLGKSIDFYSSLLRRKGILVNHRNVLLIRKTYELLRAEILNQAEWRYSRLRTATEQMVRPYLAPPPKPAEYFRSRGASMQAETGSEPAIENGSSPDTRSWNAPFPCADPHENTRRGSCTSYSTHTK